MRMNKMGSTTELIIPEGYERNPYWKYHRIGNCEDCGYTTFYECGRCVEFVCASCDAVYLLGKQICKKCRKELDEFHTG